MEREGEGEVESWGSGFISALLGNLRRNFIGVPGIFILFFFFFLVSVVELRGRRFFFFEWKGILYGI